MAPFSAIRYVAATTKSAFSSIHLHCHVKPGASKQRQGIISISDNLIEVCVAAQAREGEANKAVKEVFSTVRMLDLSPNIVSYHCSCDSLCNTRF